MKEVSHMDIWGKSIAVEETADAKALRQEKERMTEI